MIVKYRSECSIGWSWQTQMLDNKDINNYNIRDRVYYYRIGSGDAVRVISLL